MISSDLWEDIDSRLGEIFTKIPEKAFAGISVITVGDLLQLPPVRGKLIFSEFCDKNSMKHLLDLQLMHLFKHAEITEVIRQNYLFVDLLNTIRVGNIDDDVEKLLKARLIHKSDENFPKDPVQMYAENEPAMERSDTVLNDLPGELYTIHGDDKIPDNFKYPLVTIQTVQN